MQAGAAPKSVILPTRVSGSAVYSPWCCRRVGAPWSPGPRSTRLLLGAEVVGERGFLGIELLAGQVAVAAGRPSPAFSLSRLAVRISAETRLRETASLQRASMGSFHRPGLGQGLYTFATWSPVSFPSGSQFSITWFISAPNKTINAELYTYSMKIATPASAPYVSFGVASVFT